MTDPFAEDAGAYVLGALRNADRAAFVAHLRGCAECRQTGFRGRTVIAEALELSFAISEALRNNAPAEEIQALAVKQGMTTLAADGVRRAAAGETTLEEVFRTIGTLG